MKTSRRIGAIGLSLVIVLAACGSDDSSGSTSDTTATSDAPASTDAPTGTEAPAGTEAPGGGDAGAAPTELGEGEGEVNLIAWAGYVEDGSTDPAVDWVTPFEEATGCQVNVKTGNSSDEMVQLMQTGEYDGVSASGDATQRLIAGGEVAPVNTDLIPNYADVFDDLKLQAVEQRRRCRRTACRTVAAPTCSCTTPRCTPTAPDSWSEMFDASLGRERQRVGVRLARSTSPTRRCT